MNFRCWPLAVMPRKRLNVRFRGVSSIGRRNTARRSSPAWCRSNSSIELQDLRHRSRSAIARATSAAQWSLFQRSQSSAFCFGVNHVRACLSYAYRSNVLDKKEGCCVDRLNPPGKRKHHELRPPCPLVTHHVTLRPSIAALRRLLAQETPDHALLNKPPPL
jgi:hypothetical protein